MSNPNISRRTIAKGTAWSVPTIIAAASAPLAAASVAPVYSINGTVKFNQPWTSTTPDGSYNIKVYSGNPSPAAGYCVNNTTKSTTITNVATTFWFASSSLTFQRSASYDSSGCWSVLSRDTTLANRTYNGVTYYAYTSKLSCPVVAQQGYTCMPVFAWQSQNVGTSTTVVRDLCAASTCSVRLNYFTTSTATVNGTAQNLVYGPIAVRA